MVDKATELHFCTLMMQAGVCLRQDTETTLPELTEQHRIRPKEEELSGLESRESETECAAPGLNTLEPEWVTAHGGVSDVRHTHASVIKTEAALDSTHTGDLIKTESLDFTDLEYVTHLHPDQIKTETDDGGYHKAEQISELQDFNMKSDKMKCESSESLVSDLMNTVMDGVGVDLKDQVEPWQCAGEPISNCKEEETHYLPTKSTDLNHHCDKNNKNNQTKTANKCTNRSNKHFHCQIMNVITEPMIINSSLLNLSQNKIICRNKCEIHTVVKSHKCTQCEKCFTQKSKLLAHLIIHMGEKPYKCIQCGKCFSHRGHLRCHQRIHSGERPYKCRVCEKCFKTKSNLNAHQKIHTLEKSYKCRECVKCFKTKSDLNRHLRFHTGKKPYKCTQCEKSYKTKSHLNTHQKIHTGKKPYTCSQCEKCFYTKSELKTHLRIHTGEKPYKCIHCGICFSRKSNLKSHLRIHTGEKPYKCINCGMCFSQKSTLKSHQRIHTSEKPYKCINCGMCFSRKDSLNRHLRIHTGEK